MNQPLQSENGVLTTIARPWIDEKSSPIRLLPPSALPTSSMSLLNANERPKFAFLSHPPSNLGSQSESGHTTGAASNSYQTWSATSTLPDQGPWHLQDQLDVMERNRDPLEYGTSVMSGRLGSRSLMSRSAVSRGPAEILAPLQSVLHVPSAYYTDSQSDILALDLPPPESSLTMPSRLPTALVSAYDTVPVSPSSSVRSKSSKSSLHSTYVHDRKPSRENAMIQIHEPSTHTPLNSQFLTSTTWASLARKPPAPPPSAKTTKTNSTSWSKKYAGGLEQPVKHRIQDAQSSFLVSTRRNANSQVAQGRRSCYCCGVRRKHRGLMLLGSSFRLCFTVG